VSDAVEKIYVRPKDGDFEVLRVGHRRGLTFDSQDLAIEHARDMAPLVLVLNRSGKVEREVRSQDDLRALVAEYYAVLPGDVRKNRDGQWSIVERWSYGQHVGWFVEHDGYCYDGFRAGCGEDGPYLTREAAAGCMAMHLRMAIARAYALC
jgi:hypothetical protein